MKKLWLGALALLCLVGSALAAVTPNSIVAPQTPTRGILQFTSSSSAGTYATLYTGGSNGSRCVAIVTTNNDSATHLLTLQLVNSAVKYGGVAVTTVATAGFANAVPPQSLLTPSLWPGLPVDGAGNPFIVLASGDTLQATFATAITSTDLLNLYAVCEDY